MKKFLKYVLLLILSVYSFSSISVFASENVENFLLLGVDAGYEEDRVDDLAGSRSDAIMIATINYQEQTLTLSTIPRDSLVEIPNHGKDKINHAFAFGGIELTISSLENWLGINFDKYFVSNMPGFVNIVDTLGGIDVIPPTTFNWWEKFYFEKDVPQHLDGHHALAYSRERMTSGGDYARQARMREMMISVINKVMKENNIEKYKSFYTMVNPHVVSNISFDEIETVFENLSQMENLQIFEFQLNGSGLNHPDLGYIDLTNEDSLQELINILQGN